MILIWEPARCAGLSSIRIEDRLSDALLGHEFEDGDAILIDLEEKEGRKTIVLLKDNVAPPEPSEQAVGIGA